MLNNLAAEIGEKRTGLALFMRILLIFIFVKDSRKAYICIRLGQYLHGRGWKRLAALMANTLRREFACIISFNAEIGPGLRLPHPIGIVIGDGVRIGARSTIYQQVTLGGARLGDWRAGNYPVVGDDVTLFAGAKVLGSLEIGDRATVGANAVVVKSVQPGYVAAGVPATERPPREPAPRSWAR